MYWKLLMPKISSALGLLGVLLIAIPTFGSATLTPEPDPATYNFVTHHREIIHATPEVIWPVLIDLKAWMYDFDLTTESGNPGEPGQILNLYQGQDFKLQLIAAEPGRLLAFANLPITFQGEFGTGVGIFTLHKQGARTEISLTGVRRYTWQDATSTNDLRKRRESPGFQQQTDATWQRFLKRLKALSEARAASE